MAGASHPPSWIFRGGKKQKRKQSNQGADIPNLIQRIINWSMNMNISHPKIRAMEMDPKTQNGDFLESVPNGFKQNPVIMENVSLNKTAHKLTVCTLEVRTSVVDFIESLGLTVRRI
jgi:hypothetical protein